MSRESQRIIISERIKNVRKLEKELERIIEAKRDLGYIDLPKPIRDGWFRTFKLREDVKRSKYAITYQEVLEAVSISIWGREIYYADKNWKNYFTRNSWEFSRPGVKRLNQKEYSKLSTRAKNLFFKRGSDSDSSSTYSCMVPMHYFVRTYERAYIYRYKILSATLESREHEIINTLQSPPFSSFSKYYGNRYRLYFNPSKKERRRVKMQLIEARKFFIYG